MRSSKFTAGPGRSCCEILFRCRPRPARSARRTEQLPRSSGFPKRSGPAAVSKGLPEAAIVGIVRVTKVSSMRLCAICERTLLMGERSVRYSPDEGDELGRVPLRVHAPPLGFPPEFARQVVRQGNGQVHSGSLLGRGAGPPRPALMLARLGGDGDNRTHADLYLSIAKAFGMGMDKIKMMGSWMKGPILIG